MRIRPARPDDADAVFSLLKQLEESYVPDRAAFDRTFAGLAGISNENSADGADGGDRAGNVLVLVAEDDAGQVRGYALTTVNPLLYTDGSSAQLHELVVDESVRSAGIGSALVERIERECRARGVRQLTVPSRRAAGFYERLGYRSTADFLKRTFD